MRWHLSRALLTVSLALLFVGCSSQTTPVPSTPATVAPTVTAAPSATATLAPSPSTAATDTPAASVTGYNITSQASDLNGAIPPAYAASCQPNVTPLDGAIASVYCKADSVTLIEYSQFATSADLQAAFLTDQAGTVFPPSTGNTASDCATQNKIASWSFTSASAGKITGPDFGLLCYVGSGNALIEQADPTNNVMFLAALKGTDNATRNTLYQWWLNNDTTVSVQP